MAAAQLNWQTELVGRAIWPRVKRVGHVVPTLEAANGPRKSKDAGSVVAQSAGVNVEARKQLLRRSKDVEDDLNVRLVTPSLPLVQVQDHLRPAHRPLLTVDLNENE